MDSALKFDHAREALRRYESKDAVPHIGEKDEGTTDNDPDDGMHLSSSFTRSSFLPLMKFLEKASHQSRIADSLPPFTLR